MVVGTGARRASGEGWGAVVRGSAKGARTGTDATRSGVRSKHGLGQGTAGILWDVYPFLKGVWALGQNAY